MPSSRFKKTSTGRSSERKHFVVMPLSEGILAIPFKVSQHSSATGNARNTWPFITAVPEHPRDTASATASEPRSVWACPCPHRFHSGALARQFLISTPAAFPDLVIQYPSSACATFRNETKRKSYSIFLNGKKKCGGLEECRLHLDLVECWWHCHWLWL